MIPSVDRANAVANGTNLGLDTILNKISSIFSPISNFSLFVPSFSSSDLSYIPFNYHCALRSVLLLVVAVVVLVLLLLLRITSLPTSYQFQTPTADNQRLGSQVLHGQDYEEGKERVEYYKQLCINLDLGKCVLCN